MNNCLRTIYESFQFLVIRMMYIQRIVCSTVDKDAGRRCLARLHVREAKQPRPLLCVQRP